MKTKSTQPQLPELLTLGLGSIVVGALSSAFFPIPVLVYGMYGLGMLTTTMHFMSSPDKFKMLFENCKLHKNEVYPELREKKNTEYGYSLKFSLPLGLSSDDFIKHKKAIEEFLDRKVDIRYSDKHILIEVYEKQIEAYDFNLIKTTNILQIPIGYSFKGIEIVDLLEHGPHMLIAGESGSGKSTTLRGMITSLILTKDPKDLRLHCIDLKRGAELNIFRKCHMVDSFSRDRREAEETLYNISREVDRRYNLFFEHDCVDIKEFNFKFKRKKINYQIVVIDEFADLQNEKGSIEIIEELAAKARACGIHLILATQRPDAKVLNGRIKANIPCILGLKTMNDVNSRIIIDHGGLEHLRGKGHGILKAGKEIEIQSMNLKPEKARDLLKATYFEKCDKADFKPTKKKPNGEVQDFEFLKMLKGGAK